MASDNKGELRQSAVDILIGIMVFGSIWGLSEATLGGFLNLIVFPNKGAIMGSVGVAIMASALAIYRKPAMLPGIGIVAASFKWLNTWLLFVPPSSVQIINPAAAIFLESLAFGLVAIFFTKRMAKNLYLGTWTGFLAGLISATAYVYFAIYITHSPIFARLGINSIGEFVTGNAVIQAAFFALLSPLGYLCGEKLVAKAVTLQARRPLYYASSAATIAGCLVTSAIILLSGLK